MVIVVVIGWSLGGHWVVIGWLLGDRWRWRRGSEASQCGPCARGNICSPLTYRSKGRNSGPSVHSSCGFSYQQDSSRSSDALLVASLFKIRFPIGFALSFFMRCSEQDESGAVRMAFLVGIALTWRRQATPRMLLPIAETPQCQGFKE